MLIDCTITTGTQPNDSGKEIESTFAKCSKCGHETSSFGTSDGSLKRCLVLMRSECPRGQRNFYRVDDV